MLATFYSLLERLPREIGISMRFFPRRRSGLSLPSTLPLRYTHVHPPPPILLVFVDVTDFYGSLKSVRRALTDLDSAAFHCLSPIDLDLIFFSTASGFLIKSLFSVVSEFFISYDKLMPRSINPYFGNFGIVTEIFINCIYLITALI